MYIHCWTKNKYRSPLEIPQLIQKHPTRFFHITVFIGKKLCKLFWFVISSEYLVIFCSDAFSSHHTVSLYMSILSLLHSGTIWYKLTKCCCTNKVKWWRWYNSNTLSFICNKMFFICICKTRWSRLVKQLTGLETHTLTEHFVRYTYWTAC